MVGSTSCGAVLRPLARPPSCFPVRRPHTFPSAPIASSSSSGPARWTSAGYATRAARIEADLEAAESVLDADVGSDSVNARTQRRVQSYMERTYEAQGVSFKSGGRGAQQQDSTEQAVLFINYVPPYTEKEDTPGWFRAFRAAMTPRNSTVGAWGFRTRLKEAMGQVMAHKTEEQSVIKELFPPNSNDTRLFQNTMQVPETAPFLEQATESWQAMHEGFASGDLQSERCRQLLHPDLIADLEAKRKRLIDALGGAPSGPSASTSDISLSWRVHHESASPIVKGTLVTAKRRPYDEERALSQALVRWRTWQSLEIRNTKTGQLIMGNHEDPKFIMEYWVFSRRDWGTRPQWKMFRQVHEDRRPDWLVM